MVVIVIIILMVLAVVFYFKFQKSDIESKTQDLADQRADVLLSYVSRMPELQCSFRNKEERCLDSLKIIAFNEKVNKEDYYDVFGFRTFRIEIIEAPFEIKKGDCIKMFKVDYGNYPMNCNEFIIYQNPKPNFKSKSIFSVPISVYYPVNGKYFIGKLIGENYE